MTAHQFSPGLFTRGFTPPLKLSDFKLVAFDMDSTLIDIECVDETAAIAVGDGANDLPMMSVAGLTIAFFGKPAAREQAMISIESGGMEQALAVLRRDPTSPTSPTP